MNTLEHLTKTWASYVKAHRMRPGTQKYYQAQNAFFNGCYAAIGCEDWPIIIDVCLLSGRDILEEVRDMERESQSNKVLVMGD